MLCLGFSSGLPIALTASTLQAWYTTAGVSLVAIGFLTLVGQPYAYKFLWAPLMDRFIPPFLGRRRGWILISQLSLVSTIFFMAWLQPAQQPFLMASMAMLVAFLGASQDIALDAFRAETLDQSQRGIGSAAWVGGYRVGMIISGAMALLLAEALGWRITYIVMSLLMFIGIITNFFAVEPSTSFVRTPEKLSVAVFGPFKEFLSRPYAIAILLLIVLYKFGDAFAMSLSNTFYLRYLGFSLVELGTISKTLGIVASIMGAVLAGVMMVRWKLYRSLAIFGWVQGVSILAFIAMALAGKSYSVFAITVFIEQFSSGMGSTAFVALLMALCDHRYTATQFALLSALAAVGRIFIGPIAGVLIEHTSWIFFFFCGFLFSLVALGLLFWLSKRINFNAEKIV